MTRLLIILLTTVVAACGAAREGTGRGNRDVLTEQELRAMADMTAHDAIARARPEYLRTRGSRSLRAPSPEDFAVVYVDNTRMGGIEVLRSIRTASIKEIRFLGGADATTRYGTGHGAGAILISTR